ncbi:DUF1788 domain-containing protein [Ruminococcus flavefaciens]|uniref:DUF1788 domain-containing protein n=1 Tax=Ruminococcus flavefaciens TaxID=1265 RepID=UPI00046327B9|nr:DUF1788 domain-containing protein [Ruminococcus flavefaciens]
MTERSLNERFVVLEDRMISVDALTQFGTANDFKFYIFDYDPKDELIVRQEIKKIKSRNSAIIEFDLFEMILNIINDNGYMDDILNMEKDYSKELLLKEIFQPLISVEEDDNDLLNYFKGTTVDDGKSIVLITGVGKAFPIIRSHILLNNLQSIFKNNPVVMMYPGRYEIKHQMTLSLFERLDDDNYYRAFPLVERRKDI